MVQSVKDALGGVEIVQMTDMVSPLVKGATEACRHVYDGNLMTFRMNHLAQQDGWWITFDTDIVVKKDLSHVFEQEFDVALTKREGVILDDDGINVAAMMPYNTGVMFSKNRAFWQGAAKILKGMPESAHKWWGDQLSVRMAAESNRFKVLDLPCDQYNYSPNTPTDKPDVYVLHYKGKRKEWMLNEHNKLYGASDSTSQLVASD